MNEHVGRVVGVNGNMVNVATDGNVMQNEVAYILHGDQRLKSEVVRIEEGIASMQVFEPTKGVQIGDQVEFSGNLLSVTLGPGLLTQIYDGLQNRLPELAEEFGFFLPVGVQRSPLDMDSRWEFTPKATVGDTVTAGDVLGTVPEGIFEHSIMVPFMHRGECTIEEIVGAGEYALKDRIARIVDADGRSHELTMTFEWPVKVPITAYKEKLVPKEPLTTKVRIIDTFVPLARGGTVCVPGPFGAGKTVIQQIISRHAEVGVVIVAACGERAGEVVETLREFPHLNDPRTGRTLMERTIIICNTSAMPVAAREASVYTAATLGEYYRQMGLNVLMLADSTSRWAQAMRELSGRLEEIPGEEAFPAYLESRIAEFYERAGLVELNDGRQGSLTLDGTVSPAGGNFEEPVTQGTLKVVGAFHGLSRDRANARRFPSIDPLESWSSYPSFIDADKVQEARSVLQRGEEVHQMMMVVGEEGTSVDDFQVYLKGEFLDAVYLQQNGFDPVDAATSPERQVYVFDVVHRVLSTTFPFPTQDEARDFFNDLRQLFIDWNYMEWESDDFKKQQAAIETLIAEKSVSATRD